MPCRLRIKIYEARGLPVNHSNANNNNIDSLGSFVEVCCHKIIENKSQEINSYFSKRLNFLIYHLVEQHIKSH